MGAEEALELLLPDAGEARLDRARRWTSLMRVLIDDARSGEGGRVGVSLERATEAFEDHVTAELRALHVELLRVFLVASLSPTGGGDWLLPGGGPGVPESCWGALQEYRAERPWLAGVPRPDERALEVAERLQAGFERLVPAGAPGRCEVELWRARLLFARGEHESAARHLEERLAHCGSVADRIRLIAARTELYLERGAVLNAASLLEDEAELSLGDESLLELRAITALLRGDLGEARSLRALLPAPRRSLPRALADLRRRRPHWAELLPGPERASAAGELSPPEPAPGRGALGAAFLSVFRPSPVSSPAAVHTEVSPGWRRRLDGWLAERDGARDVLARAEQEVVATARVVVRDGGEGEDLRGVLGGASTRALALVPLLDGQGEVGAWLHLEFEHHLVPATDVLVAAARAWRRELAGELAQAAGVRTSGAAATWRPEAVAPDDDPRAEFFRDFAAELGMKTGQRGWWGLVWERDEPCLMARGGGGLSDDVERPGGGRGLSRVRRCGVPIRFEEPDASLSLHAAAASGAVLPFSISGRLVGCFAVESERRRDFREEDLARHAELASARTPELRTACFRAWHRERYAADLYFDVEGHGFGRRALDLALAGRVDEPVALSGPAGSGKEVLARWLHFERGEGAGELEVLRGGAAPEEELEEAVRHAAIDGTRAEPKTLLIKDLTALSPRLQGLLLHQLESRAVGLRTIVTLGERLEEAATAGRLVRALASRLGRLEHVVPPLRDRRGEIPGIVALATRRFAEEFGVVEPVWKDAAVALLWRQPWAGNVRELESLVYKAVLLHPGETLDVEHVRALAKRFHLELQKRLPSRHPRRRDLLTALRITRKQSGNPNKTRAALYLGWDPDTLVARLRDAGIDPGAPGPCSAGAEPEGEPGGEG